MDTSQVLPDLQPLIQAFIKALPVALLLLVGAAIVQFLAMRGLSILATRTRLAPEDMLPLRKVLKSILYLVTAILLLTVFGVNLGGLWAILSTILAMIAIGFVAVWSLLSHVSSTVLILLVRPFAIGDDIEFVGEAVKGRVADLNFLYTTLRTEDGCLIQIPNNLFFQKSLKRRRNPPMVSLAHQLSRDEIAEVGTPPPAAPAETKAAA